MSYYKLPVCIFNCRHTSNSLYRGLGEGEKANLCGVSYHRAPNGVPKRRIETETVKNKVILKYDNWLRCTCMYTIYLPASLT